VVQGTLAGRDSVLSRGMAVPDAAGHALCAVCSGCHSPYLVWRLEEYLGLIIESE